jgi:mannitol operon repressor
MAEDKDEPKSWQPLGVTHPHLAEFADFLPELNRESDRGMVMISMSFIDELMRRTLLAFLLESDRSTALVEGFNAPLGSLATRSAATFALGLISERELNEIDTLRRIRNQFAHHIHVSFEDPSVVDLCKNLTMAAQDYSSTENQRTVSVGARGRFSTAATSLILNLTNRPYYVSKQRRRFTSWPYWGARLNQLVPISAPMLPALVATAGGCAGVRFLELFATNISDPHTPCV